ncbi:hypothetical protein [Streptomyces sp. NPDC057617]|uniref:hypothetical protein n=1 Tax=Streptomyces sp. NPDC057617 TaxID=3346184 RepID=UPI0036C54866
MARTITGTSRVTIFPLLHTWPDVWGLVAYTTTGRFGIEAAIGYIPVPSVPDVYILDVAARHMNSPNRGDHTDWALCTGWSARLVPKPGSLDIPEAAWSLEIDATTEPTAASKYGHAKLHVGRFSLDDAALMEQAKLLLPEGSVHARRAAAA